MAVDTRQKRFSMMTVSSHSLRGVTVPLWEVDGAVDLDDRTHLLGLYSGIALGAAVADLSGTRRNRQMKSLIRAGRRRR